MNNLTTKNDAPASQYFHIAFGVDEQYFYPMGVTITSIIEHNRDSNFVFHVLALHVSEENRARLNKLERMLNTSIIIHEIDPSFMDQFTGFKHRGWISNATFIRLMIPDVLKGITERVLYLDADILCIGSLSDIFAADINDDILGVVCDIDATSNVNRLNLPHNKYFNAGVLYINIPKWIDSNLMQHAMNTVGDMGRKAILGDQDVLNVVLDGRVKYLSKRWNHQYVLEIEIKNGNSKLELPDNTALVHFIGPTKPWDEWIPHDAKKLFMKYQAASSWEDMPLRNNMNYKDMHKLSIYLRRHGNFIDSLKWFGKYIVKKYANL